MDYRLTDLVEHYCREGLEMSELNPQSCLNFELPLVDVQVLVLGLVSIPRQTMEHRETQR